MFFNRLSIYKIALENLQQFKRSWEYQVSCEFFFFRVHACLIVLYYATNDTSCETNMLSTAYLIRLYWIPFMYGKLRNAFYTLYNIKSLFFKFNKTIALSLIKRYRAIFFNKFRCSLVIMNDIGALVLLFLCKCLNELV